nr:neurogenic locus notch homolog protein 1-like [Pocillopora verrucosa]
MFVVFSNLLCLRVFSIILVDATREIKISSQSTLRFVNFVEYPSHYLDTTKRIQASNVGKDLDCSMKCFNTPSCTSLNMASAEDEDNTLWCELLFDDIFNNSQNLKQNSTSRHVTKWSPCINAPCQNGGSCVPNYNDDSYRCLCRIGFDGDNCQIDTDDCSPDSCYNGGTCVDGINAYTCVCANGFHSGNNCRNEHRYDYLWSLFSQSGHNVWVGGNDEAVDGSWVWEDGMAWGGFTLWDSVEPNGGSSENCLEIQRKNGKWNDISCTLLRYYICKN